MKTIKLESKQEEINGENIPVITTDLLRIAINTAPSGGFTVSQMKERLDILSLVEKAEKDKAEELQVEDAQFNLIGAWVKEIKWKVLSKCIVQFVSQF